MKFAAGPFAKIYHPKFNKARYIVCCACQRSEAASLILEFCYAAKKRPFFALAVQYNDFDNS